MGRSADAVVQPIRSFDEGCRRRLGIVIECRSCGKRVTYQAQDFVGFIAPSAEIETLRWRCAWCRTPAESARYVMIEKMDRQDLAQWKPPPWMKQRRGPVA